MSASTLPAEDSEQALHRILATRSPQRVHLMGVCGVGMAGVASLLKARGFDVSGCDASLGGLARWLELQGVGVAAGHSPDHLAGFDGWVIRTPAVSDEAPELAAARRAGRPVFRRGEVLPRLLDGLDSIAVAGTHGKTTTTTFTAMVLSAAGLQPGWCIGGENSRLGGVASPGGGRCMVVEADESDGTLALYRPEVAVVTNIEFDHMEHFESIEAFEACFARFCGQARRRVIYGADDPRAARLCAGLPRSRAFGLGASAAVRAVDVVQGSAGSEFLLVADGVTVGRVRLPVPGLHNVLNALAAFAAATEFGVAPADACRALESVSLPRRRFEQVAVTGDGIRVVSDYAHHPSEIRALVAAARPQAGGRLVAVFQPHRYTRTRALGADFPPAFRGVDELVLVPVYAASEPPLEGGTAGDLYARFRDADPATTAGRVLLADSLRMAWVHIRGTLRPGDLFLVVGAGDVEAIAAWAGADLGASAPPLASAAEWVARLPGSVVRAGEPLAAKTGLRVGGAADVWVEVGTEEDLAELLRGTSRSGCPLTLLGGGFNVAVSDLGARGVVARLTGPAFREIRREDGNRVVAGAAVPLSRLLDAMESQGLGGMDFLEGIPGTLGGAVRMNAGAWRHTISERVESIRCLNRDGSVSIVRGSDLGMVYRDCRALGDAVMTEATLVADAVPAEVTRAARAEVSERRAWMRGYRSAGSVFKNPEGDYAGRLLEAAGLKGARLGGAALADSHANFLYTLDGATGSDVRALIARMQTAVAARFGVVLETEVKRVG
jgi:UDP-N-acetylmuramate--L-alanine ligase/UDP-N-acetylenolpyruvoylglucosamine reductase